MKRDLVFFVLMYGAAILIPVFVLGGRVFIAIGLVSGYIIYAVITFRGESENIVHAEELYFRKLVKLLCNRSLVAIQSPKGIP